MVRFRRILCPVDFFPASERALAYALRLAEKDGARVKLLHVVSLILPMGYDYPVDSVAMLERMEEASRKQIEKLAARYAQPGQHIEIEMARGDVSTEIRKAVASFKPDLVAMGTHGHRGFQRWLIGSTTERFLRHSPVPILVISAAQKGAVKDVSFKRIMVTTDFSKDAARAFKYAFSIAQENQADITVLNVLDEMRAVTSKEYRDQQAKKARAELAKLVPPDAADWCTVEIRVEAGTPYHSILTALKKTKTDLLVMSTHGKGMMDRALLGSTTERVVKATTCPVLLIPPGRK
jgi:nucleotide-binding universal stress UspA family protein